MGRAVSRLLIASVLIFGSLGLTGCAKDPAAIANRFVDATTSGKYVEANGYLDAEIASGDESTEWLLGADAKPDFRVSEKSDVTAKVVSGSDERDYMLLEVIDRDWKITEVVWVTEEEVTEPVPYETEVTEDPDAWEGDDIVTTPGREGEATVRVTTEVVNGQPSEVGRDTVSVDVAPTTEQITRPTKPRSAGWKSFSAGGKEYSFRVVEMRRDGNGLSIVWEWQGERSGWGDTFSAGDVYVAKSSKIDPTKLIPLADLGDSSSTSGIFTEATGNARVVTLQLADGGTIDKDAVIFTWGGITSVDYTGSNRELDARPREVYFEKIVPHVWRASELYPGPIIE